MSNPIYTIGHSNHEWPALLALLREHNISAVCDVRSHPYSKFKPHFNRETVQNSLKAENIAYIYMGRELGGRPKDESCYDVNGQANYDRIALLDIFKDGLARLEKGRETHRIALMCAEKDPLNCHRMWLISRQLEKRGIPVHHILGEGQWETQKQALDRSAGDTWDMFPDDIEQANKIAYKKKPLKAKSPASAAAKPAQETTQ